MLAVKDIMDNGTNGIESHAWIEGATSRMCLSHPLFADLMTFEEDLKWYTEEYPTAEIFSCERAKRTQLDLNQYASQLVRYVSSHRYSSA